MWVLFEKNRKDVDNSTQGQCSIPFSIPHRKHVRLNYAKRHSTVDTLPKNEIDKVIYYLGFWRIFCDRYVRIKTVCLQAYLH